MIKGTVSSKKDTVPFMINFNEGGSQSLLNIPGALLFYFALQKPWRTALTSSVVIKAFSSTFLTSASTSVT
jgi:hypothetical protein